MQPSHESVTPTGTEHQPQLVVQHDSKLNKIKLALLYVLIGGLVVSALISVVAILVGEFNSVIQKALLTTFTLVVHSCIALLIVLLDKKNQLGKALIATTILVVVIANIVTSALGIWGILSPDLAWRMVGLYALFIGASFLIAGTLRLRLSHRPVELLVYLSVGLIGLMTLSLVPWIIFENSWWLSGFYYRLIGAISILAVTSLVITSIVNRIAVSQKPSIAAATPRVEPYSSGLLAIVITFGVIVSFFWLYGFAHLVSSASYYPMTEPSPYYNSYDDSYNSDDTSDPYNDTYNDYNTR